MLRSHRLRFLACVALAASPFLLGNVDCRTGSAPCGGIEGIECDATEFCDYDLGSSDGMGSCQPRPEVCPELYAPVCGIDGRTYSSECHAHAAGVTVASTGECGQTGCPEPAPGAPNILCSDGSIGGPVCVCSDTECSWAFRDCPAPGFCGGIAGFGCPEGQFCDYPVETMCGSGDQAGTCRTIPQACTLEYAPVCGCDGNTYSNECHANAHQTSVVHRGGCKTTECEPVDCGVPPLSPLPYECVPDGEGGCVWELGCVPTPCAAPPPGCHYVGGTICTCGTLVCPEL